MSLRTDIRWSDLFGRYSSDWAAVVMLGAMAWRQAAEVAQTNSALASNLQCNQWSIDGICTHLDWHGIRPDEITMQWAMAQEGAAPPVPFFSRPT